VGLDAREGARQHGGRCSTRATRFPVGTGLDQHRLSRLFTALINAVVEQAFARSSRTGRPIDPPLLLCLDEAANVAPLPNLGEVASIAAGRGVQVVSVFQNLARSASAGAVTAPRR
jgi:type IV secretion system protein VirD4